MSITDDTERLTDFLRAQKRSHYFVYTGHRRRGALLIKDKKSSERILLKPYNTSQPIGSKRLLHFLSSQRTFKGHAVDKYIFLGRGFRDNAKRHSRTGQRFTLIEILRKSKKFNIFGSTNIPGHVLSLLKEFATTLSLEVSYDFEGILRFVNPKRGKQEVKEIGSKRPTVFLSYSWDNEKHQRWVVKLASDLIRNGIKVLLDVWDLPEFGDDLPFFMERGIRDATFVLIICTPRYVKRANARSGGVGSETVIITGESYQTEYSAKFIPVVRKKEVNMKDSLPDYLKTKYALDFTLEEDYDARFQDLLRKILKVPRYKRPKLGDLPELDEERL